jgi:cytochrome c-type biogenesis protein CcmH/NrfG
MLGTVLKQSGNLDGAASALRTAIRLDPDNPGPYNTLGQVLQQKGEPEASRQAFQEGSRAKQKKDAELGKMLQKKQ